MSDDNETIYKDSQILVTRLSVSSPKSSHRLSDISSARYEITEPERDGNGRCASVVMIAIVVPSFILNIYFFFILKSALCWLFLLTGLGGFSFADRIRRAGLLRPKHFTIYVTTSRGELLLHTWIGMHGKSLQFDPAESRERNEDDKAQEERAKKIVEAIRLAIESNSVA